MSLDFCRSTFASEKLLVSSISPPKGSGKKNLLEEGKEKFVRRRAELFKYEEPPPQSDLYVIERHSTAQPQPSELLSSSRARDLISQQLHVLHVSPDEAMDAEQLRAACEYIKRCFPDLPLVVSILLT